MTRFRPCIDLHAGQVKQIVGGTLSSKPWELKTNYISSHPAGYFAKLYKENGLTGGHVVMLGGGNEEAAREALAAWPGGLQVAGGINDKNARYWIEAGAEKFVRLTILSTVGNDKSKLVLDLSCRKKGDSWFVAMNKWQTITEMEITRETIEMLEPYCSEFLIHAADVEGLQQGIDDALVSKLGEWCTIPVTYAGGGRNLGDLDRVKSASGGKVDLTIGSALDIFGGSGVTFAECVEWNKTNGS
ncbi:1-(5-phosphoribosyl)-5-((5-phosphoribosylamino)methylideneamino) imidazole-4-carboxamide isomerase [Histoplasma mississippiense (nom. inval.)]|uniref:1-(5-phosphoribosyl)-5-((5- phosphoribosylamino)methylideneamino) imidazole-4-carboxamide isomerase n=1 Tax=Ajellomyces capsulatus (strain NAm1 / WU24) TaxID=2059318 RepID=UPI000157D2A9|nr:1-(5-phosphoribosyl)-5-((5-phosphoribosylamino)methylideneamino) imidazole-4-carboxamide isomerase [Histoplasma mississippiense (nom. inval.)]EDN04888.1 1-(5-phosphoribosyl)-5-((5-phosphoribosylamino)methylideneamino) imidazole-4-carboxamide isomerase [Histoplasma mississippiense (nom. inval.)]